MMQYAIVESKKIWEALQTVDEDILNELIHPEAVFVHMGATLSHEQLHTMKNKNITSKYKLLEDVSII